jgi:hypothetical protein
METFLGGIFTVFLLYFIIYVLKTVSKSLDTKGKRITNLESQCFVNELNNLKTYSVINIKGELIEFPVLFDIKAQPKVVELLKKSIVHPELLFKGLYLLKDSNNSPLLMM